MGCSDTPGRRYSVDHSHAHRPISLPAALGAGWLSSLLPSGPSSPALFPASTLLSFKSPSLSVCFSALALVHLHLNLLSRLFHLRAEASLPLLGLLISCIVRLAQESLSLCRSCPCYTHSSSFSNLHSPPPLTWKTFKAKVTLPSKMLHPQDTFEPNLTFLPAAFGQSATQLLSSISFPTAGGHLDLLGFCWLQAHS